MINDAKQSTNYLCDILQILSAFNTFIGQQHITKKTTNNNCCALSQLMHQLQLINPLLNNLEWLEELEDQLILSNSGSMELNPSSVHFRSRFYFCNLIK